MQTLGEPSCDGLEGWRPVLFSFIICNYIFLNIVDKGYFIALGMGEDDCFLLGEDTRHELYMIL